MQTPVLVVLGNPAARHLKALERLPQGTRIAFGERAEDFGLEVEQAPAVLMAGGYRDVLRALWPRFKSLKWVHSMWAGLEEMLFPELVESGVTLTNSRGVFARSLGEFALAGMLYFAKQIQRMKDQQAHAKWRFFEVDELYGRVLGIVGYGAIGRAAAERARAFGMKIHALRRNHAQAARDPLVDRAYSRDELNSLMAASDYLLIAAPLTAETRGLVGARAIAALQPHTVLINLGRGPVVDEDALVRALQTGAIRGAVLDVFNREPLPPEHPFWSMENVLLSPHTADRTATWLHEAMDLYVENFRRFTAGEPLLNVTDKRLGY